ncbi:MAG: type VI secretion system tube protein Hcp [Lautropia sp.]|nr:type VI secretion system tube protein Hcp [Lautropia sp.]
MRRCIGPGNHARSGKLRRRRFLQPEPRSGAGAGAGKANFSDLSFMHALDKASPVLMKACAMGDHFAEATLVSRKSGKGQQDYLLVKMKEVFVTSVQPSGSSEHPMESVSLVFGHVDLEYKPQKEDGSVDAGVHFIYDLKKQVDS